MSADRDEEDYALIASLTQLPRERNAPPALEDETAGAIRARGLLRSPQSQWRFRAVAAAAAVMIFAAGWLLGSWSKQAIGRTPRYMLLLYAGTTSAAAEDASVEEYREWARRLRSAGLGITGERLDDSPAAVFGNDTLGQGRGRLRGYFVFDAPDDRRAAEIAKRHPHLRRGGVVILHRIRPT